MEKFNPEEFVNKQVEEIKRAVGSERALIAVSGGVDSTTCAALTHRAIGENLLCVMLDDAFMRDGEPERVAQLLSQPPLNLPIKVLKVQQRFLKELKGLRDAEEKRKKFRENFYKTLSETAKKEGYRFLVQGTIQADIVETTGGIKTQHNVLSQIGITPTERYGFQVIEPVASLYKGQVREVARYLGIPKEISERQPFPGPGLSVRAVGEIRIDKLESLKKATAIAEENFSKHGPSQYFAAIIDNIERSQHPCILHIQEIVARYLNVPTRNITVKVFQDKATGVKRGERHYGDIAAIKAQTANGRIHQATVKSLVALQTRVITENPPLTRILYAIQEKPQELSYVITLRAIQTRDFLTASVAEIPWTTLRETAQKILEACPNVSSVYYDVTPKPPATIEME
ncbi:MAG: GMP synthase (glutamine-hydrolyzing) subunit B [Candidatus Bathyarchaeota archaeon BA2]|nr:MAG: GMP synthase (glutamine-hydrolyzing) subunit B [Candidatus Bathyarchaeota archaeon BA2]